VLIGATPVGAAVPPDDAPSRWIVTLRDDTDVNGFLQPAERQVGFRASNVYQHIGRGFAAELTSRQRADLLRDARVAAIRPDRVFTLADQTLPPGVDRVQADVSPVARINGRDERVDADIAIIDTGIQPDHPDLNVAGGYNCVGSNHGDWADHNGHGTHVAGIAAAKDNGFGVVGVAPGARLWAVRVFPPDGTSWESWIVCGLDWVAGLKDAADPDGERIEVVNLSLRGSGGDDGQCGTYDVDLMHRAVCDAVAAGVTVVVAAGNDATDANLWTPASYDEAITVSAIADFDGKPGGHGHAPCSTSSSQDDAFARFSNYGGDVDIAAPGVCVLSTLNGGRYGRISGTSMAAPHVAGGAALYKARHPKARPSEVRGALIASGSHDWRTSTDRDGVHEPLLDVSSFSVPGDYSVLAGPSSVIRSPGKVARYHVTVGRRGGFTNAIDLSVRGLLPGMKATFSPTRLTGSADTATLEVTAPPSGPAATTGLKIIGTSGARQRYTWVKFHFEPSLAGGAGAPIAHLPVGTTAGGNSLPTTVHWSAVAGATKYEFQQTTFEGNWQNVALSPQTATSLLRWEWPGWLYRYRVRAYVGGAWQPWLTGSRHSPKDHSGTADLIRYSSRQWSTTIENDTYSTRPVHATRAGATATMTFKGREVALLSTLAPDRGRASIFIDGRYAATIDLRSSSRHARRVVYSRAWLDPGTHTIQLKVAGTTGRARVDVDAFIVFN
jgi:subtilisin